MAGIPDGAAKRSKDEEEEKAGTGEKMAAIEDPNDMEGEHGARTCRSLQDDTEEGKWGRTIILAKIVMWHQNRMSA
jgi:hypothetical protein